MGERYRFLSRGNSTMSGLKPYRNNDLKHEISHHSLADNTIISDKHLQAFQLPTLEVYLDP